uniref:Histone acetyltransferase n=1 Tax=Spongospora subterranea TaxID=70186 RepID=A0A0H5RPA1_9EUKA|eukprot:CRZ10544.1 hypothetical protein [Spongospora subterranea]
MSSVKQEDDCLFQVAFNDGREHNMRCLVGFKIVISQQLPNMPKEYIVRIVLDRSHRSIVIVKHGQVIGGICFRPFHVQGFAEIVFLAIKETEKHQGYGSRLMNHVKEHVKTEEIKFFLTYADNTAIGYFIKQGFTKKKLMPKSRWEGYIKDYVRSTLMECKIMYNINYLEIPTILKQQKEAVLAKSKTISNAHVVQDPLPAFIKGLSRVDPEDIPGVMAAGWSPSRKRHENSAVLYGLKAQLGAVLNMLSKSKEAWPFQKPVQVWEAPGYFDIIKDPMDLQTMETNLDKGLYTTKERFMEDVEKIITNCKVYNEPETIYVRCANALQKRARKLIKKIL